MGVLKIEKGKHFIKKNEMQKELYVILQGQVNMLTKNDIFPLEPGNIIGLAACAAGEYQCDYVAVSDTVLMAYPCKKAEDLAVVFQAQPKYAHVFTVGAAKQAAMVLQQYRRLEILANSLYAVSVQQYKDYKALCRKYELKEKQLGIIGKLIPVDNDYILENWKAEYYQALAKKELVKMEQFYGEENGLSIGEIFFASEMLKETIGKMENIWDYLHYWKDILLDEGKNDLFQLYFDIEARASRSGAEVSDIHAHMDKLLRFIQNSGIYEENLVKERLAEYENYDFDIAAEQSAETEDLFAEGAEDTAMADLGMEQGSEDCLVHILTYASCSEERMEEVRQLITSYRNLPDLYSTEDHVRKLRRSLTAVYYEIYRDAMKRALGEANISPIMQMFFNFGFMDVSLAGEDNANALYALTEQLSSCNSDHVYTMFEWLKSIYEGKNEPSRNEFDLDYIGYLADMKKNGRITKKEQEEWKTDQWRKVEFEIENMFRSSNRAVYGKISTFIPMLCEHDIMNSVEAMLVTARKIDDALDNIRKVDYSIFYRDFTFSDPAHDITREFLKKEVFPNIILMPNAGCNAMMWQETAGGKSNTAARFLFPILSAANIEELMIETAGRFRWEICRKETGVRWNDIRELSLTSEYYDYVQYYKKNCDLSPEAKEKMKNALWKAKNNYREVFMKDYQIWMKYESKGSLRMNKVSRGILFRYCPFSKDIREMLKENPMYQDLLHKYNILQARKKRHVELFEDKYQKAGGQITEDLLENERFYQL